LDTLITVSQMDSWLTAISSVTVSLHYLPRCLCSKVTCRSPIQWFQINPYCTPIRLLCVVSR